MSFNFFKYFGFSFEKRRQKDIALGFVMLRDKVVIVGFIFHIWTHNIGFWVTRKNYTVNCKASNF